ncbi:MAG: DUF362 domain-containing protein [Clostridia bacterium]|nr:DUF362 domain-containing protein [Clostridia bacterium]
MNPNLVSIVPCADYAPETCVSALTAVLEPLGGLDWVKPGMKIVIKANLVAGAKPDRAVTTHPALLAALTRLLKARGASVTIGDSPGNLFNASVLNRVYAVSGLAQAEAAGAVLNRDFSEKDAYAPDAVQAKRFTYTGWLNSCDAIINFCKLKSHGMMSLSAAAKNMFGTIPGTMKPEYHYRFPNPNDFADMIVDLDEYWKPVLHLCDAVTAMEGNGPTQGTPKHVGCLMASKNPHCLDVLAATVIGLKPMEVPTIAAANRRGLAPETVDGLTVSGDWKPFLQTDFELIRNRNSILFVGGNNVFSRTVRGVMNACLQSKPKVKTRACIGCGKCRDICPAHTIAIANKKAVIDRKNCIKCFCCQKFCPVGAMRVHRSPVAKLLTHGRSKQS